MKVTMRNQTWDKLHNYYKNADWIDKPNIFAQEAAKYFPPTGVILELGAGQGQDSRYFAQKNYNVISTDISEEALELSKSKLTNQMREEITFKKLDLLSPLPFKDNSFDIVYAHLSIHYFTENETHKAIKEIYRVLKPDGVFAMLNNSTKDPEYGSGEEIEKDYFIIEETKKRFFSVESLRPYVKKFKTIILDNKGETYKDSAKGVHNLIRFVGRKPSA